MLDDAVAQPALTAELIEGVGEVARAAGLGCDVHDPGERLGRGLSPHSSR